MDTPELRRIILKELLRGERVDTDLASFLSKETGYGHPALGDLIQDMVDDVLIHERFSPGGMRQVRISPSGRKMLWPRHKKVMSFILDNWFPFVTLVLSIVSLIFQYIKE